MKKQLDIRFLVLTALVLITALTRFLPHAPNFTPLMSIALFAGALFNNKKLAYLIPFAAMFISDVFLGFHSMMPAVYVSFALMVFMGMKIKNNKSFLNITVSSLSGAVIFFVLTNFAAWLSYDMYAKDFSGLLLSYEAALPFFRNTLISSVLFSYLLFGSYALAQKRFSVLQPSN